MSLHVHTDLEQGSEEWHDARQGGGGMSYLTDAERRTAALDRVRALVEEWEGWAKSRSTPRIVAFRDAAEQVRAALGEKP